MRLAYLVPIAARVKRRRRLEGLESVTSGRASGAELTDLQSTKIGVDAELYAWDGLGQAADMLPIPPENTDVEQFIVNFFGEHLGHRKGGIARVSK